LHEFFDEKGYEVIREDKEKAVDNYEDAIRLTKMYKPDIVILDIKLKSKRDGIDAAAYIKEHFNIPIIFLSDHKNEGNIERLKALGEERFVYKATKPLNKEDLWRTFQLATPKIEKAKEKTIGRFFTLKEINFTKKNVVNIENYDPVELKKFVHWDDIICFRSYNSNISDGNNNILLCLRNGKFYTTRKTLAAEEEEVPDHFARINNSTILNIKCITALGKSNNFCLVDNESFPITEKYKTNALEKIKLYMKIDI
jgi:CheY-like chemotaxis protein